MKHATSVTVRLILVCAVAVSAALAARSATASQPASVEVIRNVATLDFPSGFRFELEAESDAVIERAELRYTIPPNETVNVSVAALEPGSTIAFDHDVDLVVNYVPPGLEIEAVWQLTLEGGEVVTTEAQSLFWFDDRFDWERFESDDVRIFAYAHDEQFYEDALELAQHTVDDLGSWFGVENTTPINFWLYETRADMESALAPNSREWIGGITLPEFPTISAVLAAGDYHGVGRMIPHEVTHQVLYQATKNPFAYLANWLDEGLATNFQTTGTGGFDNQVKLAYDNGTLPTIQSLIAEWPADREQAAVSYASSYSIVNFIIDTYGEEALGDLLDGYKQGFSHDEALVQSLGVTTAELDQLWRDSLT